MKYDKSKMIYCKTLTLLDLSALCPGLSADVTHDEGNWSAELIYRTASSNYLDREKLKESILEKRKVLDKLEKDLELIIKTIKQ
ncbi:hypothetical protein HY837_06115 [archaeon]|nr:hypothetical protein [archaeon]